MLSGRLQRYWGDCAMLLGRLYNAPWETLQCCLTDWNDAWKTVQCCQGDCTMLPGRLCIAAGESVQYCWGDCALLQGRLCNTAMETVQCCCGDCAILMGDCGMHNVVVHRHNEM